MTRPALIRELMRLTKTNSPGAMLNHLNYSLELGGDEERVADTAESIDDISTRVLEVAFRALTNPPKSN